jgi:hypothetical protein
MTKWCFGRAGLLAAVLATAGVVTPSSAWADWIIEAVDAIGDVGRNPSLAIDANGIPHIAYTDRTNGCIKYATRVGGVWQTQTVPTPLAGSGSNYPSLVLDSQGRPHIVCSEYVYHGERLGYARWDGTQWVTQGIQQPHRSPWASLALTSADEPRIAVKVYEPDLRYSLHYMAPDGAGWTTTWLANGTYGMNCPALVLDSADRPRIAYATAQASGLAYVVHWEFDGTNWTYEILSSTAQLFESNGALVLDSADEPHVAYVDNYPNYTLTLAHRSGGSWSYETVTNSTDHPSLALDASDAPYVAYARAAWPYGLSCARPTGSPWCIHTIDDLLADDPDIAVAPDGSPHIAYFDATNLDLMYAWWDSSVYTGDLNCSGCVGFDDINPFVLALTNPAGYQQAFPNCNIMNGDINHDGRVNFGDINPFVRLLTNP